MAQIWNWNVSPSQITKLVKRPRIAIGGDFPTKEGLDGLNSGNSCLMAYALNRIFIAANNKIIVSPNLAYHNFNVQQTEPWSDALDLGPGTPVSHLAFSGCSKYFIVVRKPAYYLYNTEAVIRSVQNKTPETFLQWKSFADEAADVKKFEFSPIFSHAFAYILGDEFYTGKIVKPSEEGGLYQLDETLCMELDDFVHSFAFTGNGNVLVGLVYGRVKLLDTRYVEVAEFDTDDADGNNWSVTRMDRLQDNTVLAQCCMDEGPDQLKTLQIIEEDDESECYWGKVKNLKGRKKEDSYVVSQIPSSGGLCFFSYCRGAPLLINTYPTGNVEIVKESQRMFPFVAADDVLPRAVVCFCQSLSLGVACVLGSDFMIYPFSVSNENATFRRLGIQEGQCSELTRLVSRLKNDISDNRARLDGVVAQQKLIITTLETDLQQRKEKDKEREEEDKKRAEEDKKREEEAKKKDDELIELRRLVSLLSADKEKEGSQ